MGGHDAAEQGDQGLCFVAGVSVGMGIWVLGGRGGRGGRVIVVVFLGGEGGADDFLAVERQGEGGGVEGEEGVSDCLVHVAVEVGVVVVGGAGGWRRWVEVCEGDDSVVVGEAVEDGEEGVFAAGDEGDDVEGGRHGGWEKKVGRRNAFREC